MVREFPLVRSYHNLVWNLRHYRPHSQRPPFKATRHPFCTNIQLQNASCTFWLKETSQDIGRKVVTLIAESTNAYKAQTVLPTVANVAKAQPSKYLEYARVSAAPVTKDQKPEANPEVHPAEIEIVRLFSAGEYPRMYSLLKEYKAQGITISPEIITGMVSSVQETVPVDTSLEYLHQSLVEVPMFHGKTDLRYTSVYGKVYSHIDTLYDVCKLYENEGISDMKFVEKYIWLCYHMDDVATLQRLLYTYLKSSTYDSRTLSYVVSAFIYNYDVQFSNSLVHSIIAMGRPLDESLFSSILLGYILVGAIFTGLVDLVQLWTAPNCESPYPKTVALLLKQYYKFGTDTEIAFMEAYTEKLGYNTNFLVQMVKNQEAILKREPGMTKTITKSDIESILTIRNSIKHSKYALKVFYESYLLFFSKHASMSVMQQILREMKKDGLPFTKFSYNVIVLHYVSVNKFVPLLRFMQKFVSRANRFELIYVKNLFEGFVRTYPYEAEFFADQFRIWLDSCDLPSHTKLVLADACKVTRVASNVSPVAMYRSFVNREKKYLASQWAPIIFSTNAVERYRNQEQALFRLDQGLRDVMRKGVKPDYHVVESTLRFLNAPKRAAIFECLREMRMTRHITRLKILNFLMTRPSKESLESFVNTHESKWTASDKLLVTRCLSNKSSYEIAFRLLNSLGDMNDSRRMQRLNFSLRNNMSRNDFVSCNSDIDTFPINDTTLSPYIHRSCRFIEKTLKKKIGDVEAEEDLNKDLLGNMNETLVKLQGLIGDIEARLARDKMDIREMIGDMFRMLNDWIASTRNQDERKA